MTERQTRSMQLIGWYQLAAGLAVLGFGLSTRAWWTAIIGALILAAGLATQFGRGEATSWFRGDLDERRRLAVDAPMLQAVAGDLVPGVGDAPQQGRLAPGDPAEHEECRAASGIGAEPEDAFRIAYDAKLAPVPAVARDGPLECLDLEPVLDIDRQRVDPIVTR